MTWMPFVCLLIGFLFSLNKWITSHIKIVDYITNMALVLLMLVIGMNIGINDTVMYSLGDIGINCAIISLSAIACSVLLVVMVEKTILPLHLIKSKLQLDEISVEQEIKIEEDEKKSPLVWIMPGCIIAGVLLGYLFFNKSHGTVLDHLLTLSLVFLYTGVGISLGTNKGVFKYIKIVGFRVVYIPIAIFLGSAVGGLLSGLLLDIPLYISTISACGMSYYSLTGAFMTSAYGIETGVYGFIVNVMREFFTVIFLPVLIRISDGSPIASGAAGNMDTMLVPVTKFVGQELGLIALITGVILTFAVPFILPVLYGIF